MRARDKAIIDDLIRFRCMTRDDIADIHFSNVKSKINSVNTVLKRLRRDGYIVANVEARPYLYFTADSRMKKDSQKSMHYLSIVDFYKQLLAYEKPRAFDVEPKYEFMEPDVFMIWKSTPFFVEIQRSIFSDKQIKEKLNRYESYYYSNAWHNEPWQPKDKKIFPYLWVVGEPISVEKKPFKIIQTRTVKEFMNRIIKT